MTNEQLEHLHSQIDESISNAAKLQAETMKLQAEYMLTNKKAKWYELVMFGGMGIALGVALAKAFFI